MRNLDGLIYDLRNAAQFDGRTSLVVTEDLTDAIEYLERYRTDCQKRCRNCANWGGQWHEEDNEEHLCGYEMWTYADDWCSKWVEKL